MQADVLISFFKPSCTAGQKQRSNQNLGYSGVFSLLLVNFALFIASHVIHVPWVSALYLQHSHPRWWQYVTSAFCHASWEHLSSNAFMLLIFGRIVEEEVGTTMSSMFPGQG